MHGNTLLKSMAGVFGSLLLCFNLTAPVYAYEGTGDYQPTPTAEINETSSAEATVEPGLTPEGNMQLVDDITTSTGKQFITVVSKSGNYYYIIIDRSTNNTENVHFLNMVDERDLLDLMSDDEVKEINAEKEANAEAVATPTPEPTPASTSRAQASDSESLIDKYIMVTLVVGLGILAAIVIVIVIVTKHKKEANKRQPDPDENYDYDNDEYVLEEDTDDDDEY